MKRRNPKFGCVRIAQQINYAFGIKIDKDVVRRVLATHCRPEPGADGPSWLTLIAHAKDSVWSVDLFRVESILLRSHWVMLVMDVFTRRIIGFGIAPTSIDGMSVCRMFNCATAGQPKPKFHIRSSNVSSEQSGGSTSIGYFFGTPRIWRASCTITKCITTRIEFIVRSAARPPRYAPAYPQLLQPRLTVTRGGHIAAVCFRLRSPPDLYFATHRVRSEPHDDLGLGHRHALVGSRQEVCGFLTHTRALAKPHCCDRALNATSATEVGDGVVAQSGR